MASETPTGQRQPPEETSNLRRAGSELRLNSKGPLSAAISLAPPPKRNSGDFHLSVGFGGAARPSVTVAASDVDRRRSFTPASRRVHAPIPEGGPLEIDGQGGDDDEDWRVVRTRAFTRWMNGHLARRRKCVLRLERDLSDGLKLASLVRVLSGKKVGHLKRRPVFRSQKIDNVSTLLKFLDTELKLKVNRNLDGSGVVDGKLDVIFDVLWTLILHYAVGVPIQEHITNLGGQDVADRSPTQKFLLWIQGRLPEDLPVHNFTSDWKDGRALGALVDSISPGLLPHWTEWSPENALQNVGEAMTVAQKRLGLFQFIRAKDMVAPLVDELSIITYLSQFLTATLQSEVDSARVLRSFLSMPALSGSSDYGSSSTLSSDTTSTPVTPMPLSESRVTFGSEREIAPKSEAPVQRSAQDAGVEVIITESASFNDQTPTKTIWESSVRRSSRRKMPVKFLTVVQAAKQRQLAKSLETSLSLSDQTLASASDYGPRNTPGRIPQCVPLIDSDFSLYTGFSERMLVW